MNPLVFVSLVTASFVSKGHGDAISPCPDYSVTFQDSCYFIGFHQPMTFSEADLFCKSHHRGQLVEIESDVENAFVRDYLHRLSHTENFWLGLTDAVKEHSWRWFGSDIEAEYFDWAPGDPDNTNIDEDCVVFWYAAGFKWADVKCQGYTAEPVCEIR